MHFRKNASETSSSNFNATLFLVALRPCMLQEAIRDSKHLMLDETAQSGGVALVDIPCSAHCAGT